MTEVTKEVKTKVEHLVTMTDGTVVDFGTTNPDKPRKAIIDVDYNTGTVTFKVFNGFIKVWEVPFLVALTPVEGESTTANFIRTKYIVGVLAGLKDALSAIKEGDALAAEIEKQIEALDAGKLTTRVASVVKSKLGALSNFKVRSWAYAVSQKHSDYASWEAVSQEEIPADVIEAVNAKWDSYSKAEKAARRDDALTLSASIKLSGLLGKPVVESDLI